MKKNFTLLFILVSLTCFSQDSWKQEANLTNNGRYGAFYFSIGNKGYVGTGSDDTGPFKSDFWEYDPHYNVWTQKADFGGGIRAYGVGFSIGDKGYAGTGVVGSYSWTKDMWMYDTSANAWTAKDDFAGGLRYLLASFTIGSKGYVGTGSYRESPAVLAIYYNDFWEFDPSALPGNQWTRKADVPEQGRSNAVGMSIGSKGYIGFGIYYYDTRRNDLWEYDPSFNTWTRKADLPAEGRYNPSLFSIGNKGYVVGGHYYSPLKDFWEFDPNAPDASAWTKKNDFPGGAFSFGVGMTIGNKGYVGLGTNSVGPLNDWWEYRTYPVTFTCAHDTTVYATTGCTAVVNGLDPVYSPADENPLLTYQIIYNGSMVSSGLGSASGKTFSLGTSYVYYQLPNWDQQCSFTVTVLDTVHPVISCPSPLNLCYQSSNNYTIPVLTATDNCGIQNITYSITGATVRNGSGSNASGLFNPGTSTIKWSVTDVSGNVSVCTTTVKVNNPLTVTIPDTYPLLIWGNVNTIYKGFGPTCALLIAVPSGGTPYPGINGYRYAWSNGSTSLPTFACPPSTPGTYPFTVKVTDAAGCTGTATKNIKVVDARCGPNNNEVTICWFGSSQSCLSPFQAVLALYYGIGGQVGPCSQYNLTSTQQQRNLKETFINPQTKVSVFPNPSTHGFNLNIQSERNDRILIKIYDALGQVIQQLNGAGNKTYSFGQQYHSGMYRVEVQMGNAKQTLTVIKL